MSEICIKYSALEDAIEYSSKAREKIDVYMMKIEQIVNTPAGNLPGTDECGYVQSAVNLASTKIKELIHKKTYFDNFEKSAQAVIDTARQVDNQVATNISSIAEQYIEKRKWYEATGDWIYNTFCVDAANYFSLVRDFMDARKWVEDKAGNIADKIHNWFKYGNGKYVWKMGTSMLGAVVAVVGAIGAICAIPFTGGATLPIVIGCVGAVATCVGAIITVANSISTSRSNSKALRLSLEGKSGAARYYGSVSKWSEAIEKTDYGDAEVNAGYEKTGKVVDTTKKFADTTAVVCNIASLGNIKNVDTGEIDAYGFNYSNIKKNVFDSMKDSGTGKYSLKLNLVQSDDVGKYTLKLKDKTYAFPAGEVKKFNNIKTIDNTANLMKNTAGLYDFYTDSDKSVSDLSKAIENITGVGKTSKVFSIFDTYGTKTGKTVITVGEIPNDVEELVTKEQEE